MDEYRMRNDRPADSAEGLPEYADPDSSAYDTGLDRDRVDAAARPTQPEDGPYGIEGFGTTIAEQREGEPLDGRLARERPDVDPADRWLADPNAVTDPPDPDVDPPRHLAGSAVSTLDDGRDQGRQIRPDAPAEEAAMHIEEPPD